MFINSSNPVVDVGISMTLTDRFTDPASKALSSWRSMLSNMNTYSTGMQQAFTTSINRNAGILKTMAGAFDYSAKVQKNTFLTSKILGGSTEMQKDFLKQAQEINLRNPLTAMDITSGQKFMAMAGMTADKIKAASEPAAQMAAIFDMDMGGKGGTADLITNIMSTFQIEAGKAAEVADILSVGTTSANVSMTDMAQSIKYVGANAKMAGMDIKEVTAAIGVLGNYGIQGSMAGTNLGQALNTMNKAITGSSEKGLKALKAIGLDPKDLQTAEGNLIPIHDIIVKIAKATERIGGVQKQSILFNLFGMRGLRAISPLLEDALGPNNFEGIMNKLNNSSGWLSNATEEYMESPKGKIDQLTSAWENFVTTAGVAMSGVFVPLIKHVLVPVTNFLNNLASTGPGKWMIQATIMISGFRLLRSIVGLVSFGMKGIATNLLTAKVQSQGMTKSVASTNAQLAITETYLRDIIVLMSRMPGLHIPGGGLAMPGGYVIGTDRSFRQMGANKEPKGPSIWYAGGAPLAAGGTMAGPGGVIVGGAPAAAAGGLSRAGTPLYRSLSRSLGHTVAMPLARMGGALAGGFGRLFGILMGPWGMALSIGAMVLPQIFDWLVGSSSDKKHQEDLEVKRSVELSNLEKAIREGKASSVTVNVNGSTRAVMGDGDSLDINADDEMFLNGM